MSDRLEEIRARLDAWTRQTDAMEAWERLPKAERGYLGAYVAAACGCGHNLCGTADEWYPVWQHEGEVYDHAPADIAWLLDEVERLERENAFDVLEITRKASDAEDYWMQEAKRLAGRVNALIDRLDFEGVSGIEKEPADV